MPADRLTYLPLGGAGEIGMNCYVYGYGPEGAERLLVVDMGVAFPDMDSSPGVDIIFPDIDWLEERADRIEGILITHAHEDHVGAVGHTWDRLRAPIYARKFTAEIARRKLEERGAPAEAVNIVEAWPDTLTLGPFEVGFVPISHSIPESAGIAITTPAGRILHTGDFKVDETPVVGDPFDRDLWSDVSRDGVRALVCDSTNVFSRNGNRSETTVAEPIEDLIRDASGLVVATTFASNIARLQTIAGAATRAGRTVCLMGRAMQRMTQAALKTGLLTDWPATVAPDNAHDIPRENLLLLVTGSQGERRAASAQLATGKYMGFELAEGDTFLFSSKTIPGNEKEVIRIVNALSEKGVDVVDDTMGHYHVSGHANRPDLVTMHEIARPQMLIPMHGEHRHLREHAALGGSAGIEAVVAVNGMMIDLSGNAPKVAEYVETGRTYLDGSTQIGAMDGVVRDRIRMAVNGHVTVTVIVDEDGDVLGDPWVETMGLPETSGGQPLQETLEQDLEQVMNRLSNKQLRDDDAIEKELRNAVRRATSRAVGKKPEATVVVSRLA
ncbi:MAG: ribonuclease J [Paracoccaceae bacterium]